MAIFYIENERAQIEVVTVEKQNSLKFKNTYKKIILRIKEQFYAGSECQIQRAILYKGWRQIWGPCTGSVGESVILCHKCT